MSANSPCLTCTHRVVAPYVFGCVYPMCLIHRLDDAGLSVAYPSGCESHRPDNEVRDAYEQITQFEREHGG